MNTAVLDYGRSIMPSHSVRPEHPTPESQWLYKYRTDRGITQTVLSELSGLSTAAISKIESGKSGMAEKTVRLLAPHLALTSDRAAAILDEGLVAAGFVPDGKIYEIVRVRDRPETEYEVIIEDLQAAAQSGHLHPDNIRRIRRQIQLEVEEAVRLRGADIRLPSDSGDGD